MDRWDSLVLTGGLQTSLCVFVFWTHLVPDWECGTSLSLSLLFFAAEVNEVFHNNVPLKHNELNQFNACGELLGVVKVRQ